MEKRLDELSYRELLILAFAAGGSTAEQAVADAAKVIGMLGNGRAHKSPLLRFTGEKQRDLHDDASGDEGIPF